ncbi:hypothetical protein GQ42DRAFT_1796 [Ramicandelaber brevisporus]|nr:hypothetical protein GQ42DRAFT_1796 [Ramicandelaber brevisporus]
MHRALILQFYSHFHPYCHCHHCHERPFSTLNSKTLLTPSTTSSRYSIVLLFLPLFLFFFISTSTLCHSSNATFRKKKTIAALVPPSARSLFVHALVRMIRSLLLLHPSVVNVTRGWMLLVHTAFGWPCKRSQAFHHCVLRVLFHTRLIFSISLSLRLSASLPFGLFTSSPFCLIDVLC